MPDPTSGFRPHQGMPPLQASGRALSFFEFWPMWAFYPPVLVYVLWLMVRFRGILLPTAANPAFPGGGFVGESKSEILQLLVHQVPEWVAPFVKLTRHPADSTDSQTDAALQALHRQGLDLPVVAKPDLGCRGVGVKLIRSREQLARYIEAFPSEADYVLQQLVDLEGEAGVFYCRHPEQPRGDIISLTLKYFPHVQGDGQSTLRQLIMNDPRAGKIPHIYLKRHSERLDTVPESGQFVRLAFAGNHSKGSIFRNGNRWITPQMKERFEEIARSIPGFYFGRFDIRFSDFEAVQRGTGFTILEANGAGAESTHIWDRDSTLLGAWRDLMKQYRLLYSIGAANRRTGTRTLSFSEFWRWYRKEKLLSQRYPLTD